MWQISASFFVFLLSISPALFPYVFLLPTCSDSKGKQYEGKELRFVSFPEVENYHRALPIL